MQRFFGGLARAGQGLFCGHARFAIAQFAADGIRRPFGHQAVGHQFTAGDGDEAVQPVARGMVKQHNAAADVASAWVVIAGDKRAHTRVGAQDAGLGHNRRQFFPFAQQDVDLFCGDPIVVNLAVVHVGGGGAD